MFFDLLLSAEKERGADVKKSVYIFDITSTP